MAIQIGIQFGPRDTGAFPTPRTLKVGEGGWWIVENMLTVGNASVPGGIFIGGHNITEVTTATYTVLALDFHVSIQYTLTGTHIVTLPAITADNHGKPCNLKDADYNASVNNITVATTGSDTIEKQTSGTITKNGECWTLVANNTTKNWELQ